MSKDDQHEQQRKAFLQLICRSPDIGDGWRTVSRVIMPLVEKYADQTLIEWTKNDDGTGRVRLTEKGGIVLPYL